MLCQFHLPKPVFFADEVESEEDVEEDIQHWSSDPKSQPTYGSSQTEQQRADLDSLMLEFQDVRVLRSRLLELVIVITLLASFLPWHASLILKRNFYVPGNSSQSYCYSLGMVKTEAFDDSHFMHQAFSVHESQLATALRSFIVAISECPKLDIFKGKNYFSFQSAGLHWKSTSSCSPIEELSNALFRKENGGTSHEASCS